MILITIELLLIKEWDVLKWYEMIIIMVDYYWNSENKRIKI